MQNVARATEEVKTPAPEIRAFDIPGAVAYLHSIGFDGATVSFIRALISRGQLPYLKVGKKFYLTRAAIDSWLAKSERRPR